MSDHKHITRRTFLKAAGVTGVLVLSGGVYRAATQGVFSVGQGPAYDPWRTWHRDDGHGPLALVRAAILAANPHNSQPWRFRVTDTRIDLFADRQRNIGAIDPYLREMHVGLGCAIENLLLTGAVNGYATRLTLLPQASDPTHVAQIDLMPGPGTASAATSTLYNAIPLRHTNRTPYDTSHLVAPETLQALTALNHDEPNISLQWFTTEADRRKVGDLIVEGARAITADAVQSYDSAQWQRFDWSALQRYKDGITLDAQGQSELFRAAAKILPELPQDQNDQFWIQQTQAQVTTAAAFGILLARDSHDDDQRLRGGRIWQRMHLWATTQGLGMQPLNTIVERADREDSLKIEPRFGNALKELLGEAGRALMPFRLGYPTSEALLSPRRPVDEVLISN